MTSKDQSEMPDGNSLFRDYLRRQNLFPSIFFEASPSGKATDSDSVIPRFESLCLSITGC